jgi:hypothetical protein
MSHLRRRRSAADWDGAQVAPSGNVRFGAILSKKDFEGVERRTFFQMKSGIENFDSRIRHFGFYYCPDLAIGSSTRDFFDSIGHERTFADARVTSAFPSTAEMVGRSRSAACSRPMIIPAIV